MAMPAPREKLLFGKWSYDDLEARPHFAAPDLTSAELDSHRKIRQALWKRAHAQLARPGVRLWQSLGALADAPAYIWAAV